jgi:hypothetical protein
MGGSFGGLLPFWLGLRPNGKRKDKSGKRVLKPPDGPEGAFIKTA